jgi:hypothetical protein
VTASGNIKIPRGLLPGEGTRIPTSLDMNTNEVLIHLKYEKYHLVFIFPGLTLRDIFE